MTISLTDKKRYILVPYPGLRVMIGFYLPSLRLEGGGSASCYPGISPDLKHCRGCIVTCEQLSGFGFSQVSGSGPYSESGSGSRMAKMTHQIEQN
jgi:hypothetical protein